MTNASIKAWKISVNINVSQRAENHHRYPHMLSEGFGAGSNVKHKNLWLKFVAKVTICS